MGRTDPPGRQQKARQPVPPTAVAEVPREVQGRSSALRFTAQTVRTCSASLSGPRAFLCCASCPGLWSLGWNPLSPACLSGWEG